MDQLVDSEWICEWMEGGKEEMMDGCVDKLMNRINYEWVDEKRGRGEMSGMELWIEDLVEG